MENSVPVLYRNKLTANRHAKEELTRNLADFSLHFTDGYAHQESVFSVKFISLLDNSINNLIVSKHRKEGNECVGLSVSTFYKKIHAKCLLSK